MIKGPKLSTEQWKLLASAFSNISQAIILFSLAAFFVPETVGLPKEFPRIVAFSFFISGRYVSLEMQQSIVQYGHAEHN